MKSEFTFLAACFGLVLSSCGTANKKDSTASPPEKAVPKGPPLVGRIASVPPEKHFVLVQRYGKWEGQTGQILTTRGPDNRTANLRTTGEKLGEFAAADIQSGIVEIGDAVYLQIVPSPPAAASSLPDAEVPAEITNESPTAVTAREKVQKNN